ncbi:hypothetical protein C5167_048383 [Papaver somniferum]|uniref:Uncharacterized protein n=1 Tax=Papaver somniferum TaxID=3469 RepID=A0A4Y7KKI7_PAPSO|nr:hypothetical protein C5167_048383 [Papaver somniferum]
MDNGFPLQFMLTGNYRWGLRPLPSVKALEMAWGLSGKAHKTKSITPSFGTEWLNALVTNSAILRLINFVAGSPSSSQGYQGKQAKQGLDLRNGNEIGGDCSDDSIKFKLNRPDCRTPSFGTEWLNALVTNSAILRLINFVAGSPSSSQGYQGKQAKQVGLHWKKL